MFFSLNGKIKLKLFLKIIIENYPLSHKSLRILPGRSAFVVAAAAAVVTVCRCTILQVVEVTFDFGDFLGCGHSLRNGSQREGRSDSVTRRNLQTPDDPRTSTKEHEVSWRQPASLRTRINLEYCELELIYTGTDYRRNIYFE